MSHSKFKILTTKNSALTDYPDLAERHKLLGWANETLSRLKSDKHFLRKTLKKNIHEGEVANAKYHMALSKKNKCVEEEISKLKTNDTATYVSEIVTSKTKRKIQHVAFEPSVTKRNWKNKGSNEEHLQSSETKENGDNQRKVKAKHRLAMLSCSEDVEGKLNQHEESTQMKKKKKNKKKHKESADQKCSADITSSEDSLILWGQEDKERPRKKHKLTKCSKSDIISCHHCCKCIAKEDKTQKKEINTDDEPNMFDYVECVSGTRRVKKCDVCSDLCTGSKNESVCFLERVMDTDCYKQDKKKQSKHTFGSMLGEGEQLSNGNIPNKNSKEKKKDKRCHTHSVSKQLISEKNKVMKYKLYTQKYKCDEDNTLEKTKTHTHTSCKTECTSERRKQGTDRENSCDHTLEEYKRKKKIEKHNTCNKTENSCDYTVEEHKRKRKTEKRDTCNKRENSCDHTVEEYKRKRKTEKHDTHNKRANSCDYTVEEHKRKRKTEKRGTCNKNENSCDHTVEEYKRKRKTEKHDTCNKSEIVLEAEGPEKKKMRKKKKCDCEDNDNMSNSGERDKQKLYFDRNNVYTVGASFIEETQKKKHKKAKKNKYDNLSGVAEEGSEKVRHEEIACIGEDQKTNEFMDHESTSTTYYVKRKDKTRKKRKSETEETELVESKKNKVSSVISQEGVMGYEDCDLPPELTQTVRSLKENNNNNREILTSIIVSTHKNVLHNTNIKRSKNIGSFGLSPMCRLLDMESEFSDVKHSCQTCCRCKLHPEIRHHEICKSAAKDMSNIVIKTEPGVIIKQEKEVSDDIDPHIMDKQVSVMRQGSHIDLNTNNMKVTDGSVKKEENDHASIDKPGRQEQLSTGSGDDPNGYSAVTEDMLMYGNDSEFGTVECVESFGEEVVVNGNEEIDVTAPVYNIYDDKITVKEEIFQLTNAYDNQRDGRNHMEDVSQGNFECVGEQDMAYMDSKIELPSVGVLGDTVADMIRTTNVEEVNGSNLNTVPQYEAVPLNKPQEKACLEIIPEAAGMHNSTWNAAEYGTLHLPSVSENEHLSSQCFDVTAFTTGQVRFRRVPKWWTREKIAKALGVPFQAVYIRWHHYNPIVKKNYVTVDFHDNQQLQKIVKNASRIHCSGWFVTRIWSQPMKK